MDTQLVFRLIELVRKTGDRLILADPSSDNAVVVMDLAAYERLLNQAGEQLVSSQSEIVSTPEQPSSTPSRNDVVRPVTKIESAPVEPLSTARSTESSHPQFPEPDRPGLEHLTAVKTGANINREIGIQSSVKNVIESMTKSSFQNESQIQNQATVQQSVSPPAKSAAQWSDEPEEEARFYLEPIE